MGLLKKLNRVGNLKIIMIILTIIEFSILSEHFGIFLACNMIGTTLFLLISTLSKAEISELGDNIPKNTLDFKVYCYINLAFKIGPIGLLAMVINGWFYVPLYVYFWRKHYPRKQGEDHEKFLDRLAREKTEKIMRKRAKNISKVLDN